MPKHSVTPFTYYTFRYDYTDEQQLDNIMKYIVAQCPKYAIFKEVSDVVGKNHVQGKIGKAMSNGQLRKNLLAEFPNLFNRSNYSCTVIEKPEEYDSYICKQGEAVINNIFTPEYIADAVKLHKDKIAEFTKKETKRSTVLPFTHRVALDFMVEHSIEASIIQKPEYKPNDYELKVYQKACDDLLLFLLKRLGKIAKCFDDNILQRMYTGIKNYIVTQDAQGTCKQLSIYKGRLDLYN